MSNGVLPIAQCRSSNPRALLMPGLDPGTIVFRKKLDCRVILREDALRADARQ
jgi:hypothetical protein